MAVRVFFQNRTFVTFTKTSDSIEGCEDLDIQMGIPFKNAVERNCWQEDNGNWGSQYDISIYNHSKYSFVDWVLVMTIPEEGVLDSSWNANYALSLGKLTITGIDKAFTKTIHERNSIKIGYVMYSKKLMHSSDFYLTGRFIRNPFKEIPFIIGLFCLGISLIVILVSLFFYRMIRRQTEIDNEKIDSLLKLCASFIDTRDEYTKMHSTHVGSYSKQIAAEMGYDEDFQRNIYYMGMMHDVGKVLIPKEILCKPGKLDEEEWKEMKRHTVYGGEILGSFNAVKGIREAALHHHERYDGAGYPKGLKGTEIPVQARIIAVADSFDAMHTNRSYRKRLSDEVILEELEKNKGIQFDPEVADAMLRLIKKGKLRTDEQ
ncbi:HD domain-containing phosphohydrolase [uncultured Treponema sp.]|uniref:HD domain-containing phosphohydrolase n=1 Tax=uncultured Treponema sp. TaxID=162155 RepID=UPI0025F463B8|nr:HD domain-containing phosphohydrolase [uncultured Treponema sp.]